MVCVAPSCKDLGAIVCPALAWEGKEKETFVGSGCGLKEAMAHGLWWVSKPQLQVPRGRKGRGNLLEVEVPSEYLIKRGMRNS